MVPASFFPILLQKGQICPPSLHDKGRILRYHQRMKNVHLSNEEIQNAVADHEGEAMMIREKISALQQELAKLQESVYEYLSWYDGGAEEIRLSGQERTDPVNRIVEKKEREYQRFRQEFLHALAGQEERLARLQEIRLAYLSLPADEYMVMRTLYEEKIPWKAAAERLSVSRRTLADARKRAIAHIRAAVERMELSAEAPAAAEPGIIYGKQE